MFLFKAQFFLVEQHIQWQAYIETHDHCRQTSVLYLEQGATTHDLSIPVSCRLFSVVLAFKNTPEWEQKGEHVKICRQRNNCADGVSTLKLFYPFLLIIFPPYFRCVKNNWSLKCILQCLQEEIALLFLFVVGGFKIVLGELIW